MMNEHVSAAQPCPLVRPVETAEKKKKNAALGNQPSINHSTSYILFYYFLFFITDSLYITY